jgi:hypothetical protein
MTAPALIQALRNVHLPGLGLLVVLYGCSTWPVRSLPLLVEVRRGGDDGLTLRLADAVETAFRCSRKFILSDGRHPGALIVTIPTNVEWRRIDNRTRLTYSVEFTGKVSRRIGARTGACWEDELSECANQVLREAEIVTVKKP